MPIRSRFSVFLFLLAASMPAFALEIWGEWEQGALILGRVPANTSVVFMGRPLRLTDQGEFILGLGRDAPETVELRLRNGTHEQVRTFQVRKRQYKIQRVDGVPQRTVTPPEDVLDRIRRESAMVKKARATERISRDFIAGFRRPLEGPITGVYGSQRIYNGEPRSPHYGLDIAAPEGTLVSAPAPGEVTLAHPDMYFSGGTLIVDHGYGLSSTFIHLSEILVKPGQRIEAGQPIARVGATGRATGPHLDWRMNWFDVRVDPATVLKNFSTASRTAQ